MKIIISTDTDHSTFYEFEGTKLACEIAFIGMGYCGCKALLEIDGITYNNMNTADYTLELVTQYNKIMNIADYQEYKELTKLIKIQQVFGITSQTETY